MEVCSREDLTASRFLPEWESCSRGPVWLQVLASGAVLESAGCRHDSERRHTIRKRRVPTPPAKIRAISERSPLMCRDRWKTVGAASHITPWASTESQRGQSLDVSLKDLKIMQFVAKVSGKKVFRETGLEPKMFFNLRKYWLKFFWHVPPVQYPEVLFLKHSWMWEDMHVQTLKQRDRRRQTVRVNVTDRTRERPALRLDHK